MWFGVLDGEVTKVEVRELGHHKVNLDRRKLVSSVTKSATDMRYVETTLIMAISVTMCSYN